MSHWYLLYGGSSEDGSGPGHYVGRTLNRQDAYEHLRNVHSSPYNTGYVLIVTDTETRRPRSLRDFLTLSA